jgi:CheY-like chemotaxis protein
MMSLVTESIDLEVRASAERDDVSIDPSSFRQIVLNLLLNARDALAGTGHVLLMTENVTVRPGDQIEVDPGEYLALTCEDDGVGMVSDVLSRALEPFFTTRDEGTGLGLTSVHRIVNDLGGCMNITSQVGRGTSVKILMPLSSEARSPLERIPTSAVPERATTAARILLVEDDDDVRPLLARALRRLGHEVIVAAGGSEALALAGQSHEPIDLVLTDVLMPGLSGAQVVEQLRASRPQLKVLYMSGYASDELARRGINDSTIYLQKPFQVGELAERIATMLA